MVRAIIVCCCFGLLLGASICYGQGEEKGEPKPDFRAAYQTVLAKVGEQQVTQGDVDSFLRSRFPKQRLAGKQRLVAENAALEHLVKRRIVYAFLVEKKYAPSTDEIDTALERFENQAKGAKQSLEELVAEKQMTFEHFRYEAAWKLAWERYLKIKLNDAVIEKFFQDHKRNFDGTQIGVSQILRKLKAGNSAKAWQDEESKLEKLRSEILAGNIGWNEAVSKYSDAPSKAENGNLGLISIDGPMDRAFTEQVFELQTGQISQPFRTRFGVHLVRCDSVVAGKLGFRDNYDAVKQAAMKDRFEALYDYQIPNVVIEYTKR